MLHFHFEGNRMKFSTGYKIALSDWNVEKQRVKTNKAGILIADEVNEHLSNLEVNLKKEYSRLRAEGATINKAVIKAFLDSLNSVEADTKEPQEKGFWEVYSEFISLKSKQVKPITLRAHKQTVSRLREYEKEENAPINFETVDLSFYENFTQYLREKCYSTNTIGKHIKNLKVFMSYSLFEGHTSNRRFQRKEFKVQTEQTTAIYLTDEELDKIRDLDLSFNKNYEKARDIFLIGCYTGQRVSDYNNLSPDNIVSINDEEYLRIIQQKTGETVHIPITTDLRLIFNRYGNIPPTKIPEQKLNQYIKIVGRIAGIKEKVRVTTNNDGVLVKQYKPKYELISSHTARRSFCTNMYKRGKRIDHIMFFSGHKTEKEFYKYIRIEGEEKASHLVQSGFFKRG